MSECGNSLISYPIEHMKKGNSYGVVIVDSEKSHFEVHEELDVAAENDSKCTPLQKGYLCRFFSKTDTDGQLGIRAGSASVLGIHAGFEVPNRHG